MHRKALQGGGEDGGEERPHRTALTKKQIQTVAANRAEALRRAAEKEEKKAKVENGSNIKGIGTSGPEYGSPRTATVVAGELADPKGIGDVLGTPRDLATPIGMCDAISANARGPANPNDEMETESRQ